MAEVIAAPAPLNAVKIHDIGQAEILEWAQELLFERVPQAQLRGDATSKPVGDIDFVCTLRRSRHPEQHKWLEML